MSHWWTLRLATSEGRWPTPIAGQPGQRGPVVMSPPIARYRQVGEHKWSWGKQRIASLTPFLVLTIYIYIYILYIYIYYTVYYIYYCSNLFMLQDFADFHLTLQQIFLWHSDLGFGISQVIPNLGWLVAPSLHPLVFCYTWNITITSNGLFFFLWTIKDWPRLKEKYSVYICIYIYIL